MRRRTALAAAALLAAGFLLGWLMVKTTAQEAKSTTDTGPQTLDTRIGKLTFTHDFANGYPTKETVERLYDERDYQRACQAYLWALPLVSAGEIERVFMQAPGAAHGDILMLDTFPALSRFLTANATTPYALTWINLAKSGPFDSVYHVAQLPPSRGIDLNCGPWRSAKQRTSRC